MKKIYLFLFAALLSSGIFAQYSTNSFTFGGVTRQYLLYIPAAYDGSKAVPFVMALHGLGDNINNFAGVNFNSIADTANFIFAIPQALVDTVLSGSTAWNSGAGEFGITLNPNVDDVGFLNALIDTVSAHYMIDQTRLYSTGFSMGGFMTNRLGCELNNRIAAIASVSGTIGNGITCNPARVVPSCHFHGTSDQTVGYTGDMFGSDAEALVAFWRSHDQCSATPSSIDTFPHISSNALRVVHFVYPNGAYGSDVEFYKVLGGAHQWLGPTGDDVNYALEIWKFFSRYTWEPQSPAAIAELNSKVDVAVYPNPAKDELNIKLVSSSTRNMNVAIHDIMGRLVYSGNGESNISVNTASFAQGSYTVDVVADGKHLVRRIAIAE